MPSGQTSSGDRIPGKNSDKNNCPRMIVYIMVYVWIQSPSLTLLLASGQHRHPGFWLGSMRPLQSLHVPVFRPLKVQAITSAPERIRC